MLVHNRCWWTTSCHSPYMLVLTHHTSMQYNNIWGVHSTSCCTVVPCSPAFFVRAVWERPKPITTPYYAIKDSSYGLWHISCTRTSLPDRSMLLFPPTKLGMSESDLLWNKFCSILCYECFRHFALCPQGWWPEILQSLWQFVKFFAKCPPWMFLNSWRPYTFFCLTLIFPIRPCRDNGLHLCREFWVGLEVRGPCYVPTDVHGHWIPISQVWDMVMLAYDL